ncbi:hypothetical protein [Peribacillus frigoritolerans]|uniref:hypothetical protein n=1 Tax=Peribacillus frigoritolerans TaxID=450367 RepID=UPI002EB781F9|nr:hypothetical protein [Peribacillus frigoritolerans]
MDANKMISALGGMIYASDNHPKSSESEWLKDFLIEIKTLIEEQQKEIKEHNGQYIDIQELLSQTEKVTNELISLNLWSARRLHKIHKEFAYNELDKITGQKHERL